jgi:peptidoglycan-N-acetylglucosamine deacetylase
MDTSPSQDPDAGATLFPLAPFHLAGLAAVQVSLGLWWLSGPVWAILPPVLFLFFSFFVAPFVQPLQFFLPIVTHGNRRTSSVALTFDDGPDPLTTPGLLDLLAEHGLKATFFVLGEKVQAHPELVEAILGQGHEIGNHSQSHDVFLMLRRIGRVRAEIRTCQMALERFGVRPLAFRPPVGVTNPRLWRVLLRSGMYCAGFSRRARDMGNLRVRGIAGRILKQLRPGDVLLLHDCRPWRERDAGVWLKEVRALVGGIRKRGLEIQPLSRVIRRPVMESAQNAGPDPVRTYYDVLAASDPPQPCSAAARAEQRWFQAVEESIRPGDRVLEIGAGAGRFTLPIARRACEVVATDLSPGSLEILRQRAARNGLNNIRTIPGDARRVPGSGMFDVVCSFSAFEYFPDLPVLLEGVVQGLKPGGRLFFTTAHRSVFRLFAQIGNAMRQGVWLHARTRGEISRLLESLGMEVVSVATLGMKLRANGGLVLAASARKRNDGGEGAALKD